AFRRTIQSYLQDIHPEDRESFTQSILRTIEQPEAHTIEYRVVWPDGTVRWAERRGRLFHDAAGRAVRMSGVCMDITGRKQAEAPLRESEARKTAILETALDAIITIDYEGKVVEFNSAAEATFGYTREEACGRPIAELVIPARLREAH